jgi:hypothetical protein
VVKYLCIKTKTGNKSAVRSIYILVDVNFTVRETELPLLPGGQSPLVLVLMRVF